MSTDAAGSTDAIAPDTPTAGEGKVRETAEAILADPDHRPPTVARFAGVMYRETGIAPVRASELYADLTGGADAPADGVESDTTEDTERSESGDVETVAAGKSAVEETLPTAEDTAGDPDPDTNSDEVTPEEHFERLEDAGVYAELGDIDGRLSCLGNQDFRGWYKSRTAAEPWDGNGRAFCLAREFDDIRAGLDRVLYATINYAPIDWFIDAWDRFKWVDGGREWKTATPTPEYADTRAYAPFADIDLADDVKRDRPAGDIPRGKIEGALGEYIETFADLAGGREHVFALDSVGGAYVMIAPTSTAPIAEAFDRADRELLFDELTDRLNDWLDAVDSRVVADNGLEGVFEADLLNNKNRLYKAPLSLHSSLDGVVTPIDTAAPEYQFTPFDAVDGELIDETKRWARGFTADHTEAVEAIVDTLWSDYSANADTWSDALAAWLEDKRAEDERNEQRERDRLDAADIPDDLETTDSLDVIKAAVESIDVEDFAVDLADETTERSGGEDTRFDPPWRQSSSGESCFANADRFYDLKEGAGGGALELVALERGIMRRPGDGLKGDDYWRAVNALREEGYDIPYFEGKGNRKHADVLRLFEQPEDEAEKKRQLARAIFCTD